MAINKSITFIFVLNLFISSSQFINKTIKENNITIAPKYIIIRYKLNILAPSNSKFKPWKKVIITINNSKFTVELLNKVKNPAKTLKKLRNR
jgi:hypothetical protein